MFYWNLSGNGLNGSSFAPLILCGVVCADMRGGVGYSNGDANYSCSMCFRFYLCVLTVYMDCF